MKQSYFGFSALTLVLALALNANATSTARQSIDVTPAPTVPTSPSVPAVRAPAGAPFDTNAAIPSAEAMQNRHVFTIPMEGLTKGISLDTYLAAAKAEFAKLDKDKNGIITRADLPKVPAMQPVKPPEIPKGLDMKPPKPPEMPPQPENTSPPPPPPAPAPVPTEPAKTPAPATTKKPNKS